MSKHTPGPWNQGHSDVGKEVVFLNGLTEPEKTLGPDDTWIDCVTEANARLIAAAPELLDALQRLLEQTRQYGHAPEIEDAERAIAKATGEQQ